MPTATADPPATDSDRPQRPDASRDRRLLLDCVAGLLPTLAHEVKNPLAVIQSSADLLSQAEVDADAQQDVEAIVQAVHRLRCILDRYGAVRDRLVLGPGAPLVDVVPSIIGMVREEERKCSVRGIDIRYEGPETSELRVSPPLLLAIVDHLLRNAREAARTGDTVLVTLAQTPTALTLGVADSGPGMNAAELARATDLFYSTKPGHAGLGLALAREIVERSGGELLLRSEAGSGTEVSVRVPVI